MVCCLLIYRCPWWVRLIVWYQDIASFIRLILWCQDIVSLIRLVVWYQDSVSLIRLVVSCQDILNNQRNREIYIGEEQKSMQKTLINVATVPESKTIKEEKSNLQSRIPLLKTVGGAKSSGNTVDLYKAPVTSRSSFEQVLLQKQTLNNQKVRQKLWNTACCVMRMRDSMLHCEPWHVACY